jgi:AcrR family transcriptional regulator
MARSAEATRARIIDAAYGEFWRIGFVRASLDDIAARAKVTKRTLYVHFRSKDDLIAEVLAQASELALERLRRMEKNLPEDAEDMIDRVFRDTAKWATTKGWAGAGFTRVVSELADLPGHPARQIARKHKTAVEVWFGDLLTSAGVASPMERGREIAVVMEGALSLMLIHGDESYAEIAARAAKRLIAK